MRCMGWEERVALYAGGDLPAEETGLVEQHLERCADCTKLARLLDADRLQLQTRPPELAGIDFDGMRRQLHVQIARRRLLRRWAPVVAVAAALLVAAAVTPRHVKQPVISVQPPPVLAAVLPQIRPAEAPPRKRRPIRTASTPVVEMRLTTADPDVTIILLPVTTENPHE
jgi:hypothetical protein